MTINDYQTIERTTKCLEQTYTTIYILTFMFHIIIHIGIPLLFLTIFDDFMTNTTKFFQNETYEELGLERSMYFLILFNNITYGVFEIMFLFIKDMRSRETIFNASAFYSFLLSTFYLIIYYSYLDNDNIDITYLQTVGFLEIINLIFWFLAFGIHCFYRNYKKKKILYKDITNLLQEIDT